MLAALLTIFYVTNYKKSVQQGEDLVPVWVAARDISVGTSGSEVGDRNLLRAVEIAKRSVVPGAISKPEQIEALVATERIYEGEQITLTASDRSASRASRPSSRAGSAPSSSPGNEHQLLMGTVEEGDHVDFVGSLESEVGSGTTVTKVVLRDLLVLKAPSAGNVESKLGARPDEAFSAILARHRRPVAEALPRHDRTATGRSSFARSPTRPTAANTFETLDAIRDVSLRRSSEEVGDERRHGIPRRNADLHHR